MTIRQPHLQTTNVYLCLVKRASVFNVFFQPERWEVWRVLADDLQKAFETAKYHFYRSIDNEIFITTNSLTTPSGGIK